MKRFKLGSQRISALALFLLVLATLYPGFSAYAQIGSGTGFLYPSAANPFAPRPYAPPVQPTRPPRPYRGYWTEVGYQGYGFYEGGRNCAHFLADLGYGAVQVGVRGVSLGYCIPPNPENWESPALAAYDARCKQGEQFDATYEAVVNVCTLGIPSIAQGLSDDLRYGENNTTQHLGGAAAASVIFAGGATGINSIKRAVRPKYPLVDLMGGPESQLPGALNVDAQCLPGKGLKVPEGPTLQTGLPRNSVSEIVCSNPQAAFLEEVGKILQPGGKFYVNYTKGNGYGLTKNPGIIKPKFCDAIKNAGLEVEVAGGPLAPRFNSLKMARTDGTLFEPGTTFYTSILKKPLVRPAYKPWPGLLLSPASQDGIGDNIDPNF